MSSSQVPCALTGCGPPFAAGVHLGCAPGKELGLLGTRWPFFKERGHNACLSSYWAGSLELEVAPSGKPKGRVPLYAELAYRAGRNTHLSASAPTTSDVTLYFWWEHFSKEQPWI